MQKLNLHLLAPSKRCYINSYINVGCIFSTSAPSKSSPSEKSHGILMYCGLHHLETRPSYRPPPISHGSMYDIYIYLELHVPQKVNQINVGKYPSPTDSMGYIYTSLEFFILSFKIPRVKKQSEKNKPPKGSRQTQPPCFPCQDFQLTHLQPKMV